MTDKNFMQTVLPSSYTINDLGNRILCRSKTGIAQDGDGEDNEHWGYIEKAIKQHFGDRFIEIIHQVNFCHRSFSVWLKPSV